ncbi:MAG: hypothetical protein BWY11_01853 [Firmicutes bacterium ADurb.Bin182]|nr:MAG: hypothetical protein BWY11_01853 [Firmicutes bacterium ADurb.Bin182]
MKRLFLAVIALLLLVSGCQPSAPGNEDPVEILPEATPEPEELSLKIDERSAMLAVGTWHIAMLRNNGTVLAAGDNGAGQCDVSGWQDVAFIAASKNTTVGLTGGGKLLIAGERAADWETALSWENIVKVAVGDSHIVGLKSDGTVVAAGDNGFGQCDTAAWENITAVKASLNYTLGKSKDGEVFSAGSEPASWDAPDAEIPEIKDGTWANSLQAVQNENIRSAILDDGSVVCAGEYADLSNLTANWNANGDTVPEPADPNAEKMSAAVQKNGDVKGYILLPGVDVDRPILYGKNYFYNDHDIDKKKSNSGEVWLFKDTKNRINAITGHNMRVSGTMFHQLHHIQAFNNGLANCEHKECNAKLENTLPDLTKYPDRVWNISLFGFTRWEVFSYYEVKANEPVTTLYFNTDYGKEPVDIEEWISIQTSRSQLKLDVEVTPEDTFLTIYTCGDEYDYATAQSRLYFFLKAVG